MNEQRAIFLRSLDRDQTAAVPARETSGSSSVSAFKIVPRIGLVLGRLQPPVESPASSEKGKLVCRRVCVCVCVCVCVRAAGATGIEGEV